MGMFSKRDWLAAVRQWPTSTIVGLVFGAICASFAKMIGIPTLDQLEWPALTGLGYIVIFFVSGFLSVLLLAVARWATGGLMAPRVPVWLMAWLKKRTAQPTGVAGDSLPLLVTLSGLHFNNYAGLCPEGAAVVSVKVPGGQSTVATDKSIDNQVFVLTASITNLSENRMILQMRLLVANKEGREISIAAGNKGSWGLRMGEHDAASVMLRKKGMPVAKYFDFPLTIEGRSNLVGRVAFIVPIPRDLWYQGWVLCAREVVEITDILSGERATMSASGTYRGAAI